jgi:DNA-binding beta-propeller fold protein YncE
VPVSWSVEEAGGGAIDDRGVYRAPGTSGVFHVRATSLSDANTNARATVSVAELQVSFLAGGSGGPGDVDGVAQNAHFRSPKGLAAYDDPAMSDEALFVADTGNHTIRKVDRAAGRVGTLAGTAGLAGFVDATGASARFNSPTSVAADPTTRTIYVADSQNHCIRAIDDGNATRGKVTTFAGLCGTAGDTEGVGTAARFNLPTHVVVQYDPTTKLASNLVVCELGQRRMRLVSLLAATRGQTSQPLAGHAFNFCDAGVFDFDNGAWDRLYFTDASNPLSLHRWAIGSTAIDSVAALPSESIDGGPPIAPIAASGFATDTGFGNGHSVYVSFADLAGIYQYDANGTVPGLHALVGSASEPRAIDGPFADARFERPGDMVVPKGREDLFVIDEGAQSVRHVDLTQSRVDSPIGRPEQCHLKDGSNSDARFALPLGVASDGAGHVYVADGSADSGRISNTIRAVDLTAGTTTLLSGKPSALTCGAVRDGDARTATFGLVLGLVVEGDAIYAVDAVANAVRKIVLSSGEVTTVAGRLGVAGDSQGIGGAALFKTPVGITSDGAGNLYVSDSGNAKIKKIELATGKVETVAGSTPGDADGPAASARFNRPGGLALDPGGALYVADSGNHTIRRIDGATGAVTTFFGLSGVAGTQDGDAAHGRLDSPSQLAIDRTAGVLYVIGGAGGLLDRSEGGVVRRIDIASRSIGSLVGRRDAQGLVPGPLDEATLGTPSGLLVLPSGDVVFTDVTDCSVGIVKPL